MLEIDNWKLEIFVYITGLTPKFFKCPLIRNDKRPNLSFGGEKYKQVIRGNYPGEIVFGGNCPRTSSYNGLSRFYLGFIISLDLKLPCSHECVNF